MNVIFFGGLVLSSVIITIVLPPGPSINPGLDAPNYSLGLNWPFMLLAIFLSNLALSAFLLLTTSGFIFFPASAFMLGYRALLWSLILTPLPNNLFVAVLPTMVLEGEAYALAAVAGTLGGISWLKPAWLQPLVGKTRRSSFKLVLKECSKIYVLVVLLLFVSAIVESATIIAGY
jgi:hypothetical protein